jgi:hypothetical protein
MEWVFNRLYRSSYAIHKQPFALVFVSVCDSNFGTSLHLIGNLEKNVGQAALLNWHFVSETRDSLSEKGGNRTEDRLAHIPANSRNASYRQWGRCKDRCRNCCGHANPQITLQIYAQAVTEAKRAANAKATTMIVPIGGIV